MRWDLTGFFIRRKDGSTTLDLDGTDAEALEFSVRARNHFDQLSLRMIQARSVGTVDLAVPNETRLRELARLRPHKNGKDWTADQLGLHHGGWFRTLENAIDYAAFRLRGHLSEIQIFNRAGELDSVILIDQTGAEPAANGPSLRR